MSYASRCHFCTVIQFQRVVLIARVEQRAAVARGHRLREPFVRLLGRLRAGRAARRGGQRRAQQHPGRDRSGTVDAAHPPQIAEMARLSKRLAVAARSLSCEIPRSPGVLVSGPQLADFMSDPPTPPAAQPQPPEDEFANVRARAGRHPALALGAAALALFIIFHVRADITYALSSAEPIDLGDAAATFAARRRARRRKVARPRRDARSAGAGREPLRASCAARPTARARSSSTPRARGSSPSSSASWARAAASSFTGARIHCPRCAPRRTASRAA